MEIKMVLYLPRDAASVPVSRQVLDSCLKTLGVTPDTRADIALAISEACANVIQHAGPGEEYEVQVRAKNCRCAIEVVNTGSRDGEAAPDRNGTDTATGSGGDGPDAITVTSDPVPDTAEHGRGLKIIDAVVDNLQLTGNESRGTTVHFEKTLEWLPGAAGQQLFSVGGTHNALRDRSQSRALIRRVRVTPSRLPTITNRSGGHSQTASGSNQFLLLERTCDVVVLAPLRG